MAVGNRLGKVEGRVGPRLCAEGAAPCQTVTTTELRIMPFGAEERSGAEMRPLCGPCPNRESRAVLHVEVRLDYRNRFDGGPEVATSGATLVPVGPDGAREGHGSPGQADAPTAPSPDDLALPAAWGPEHPARLAAQGREPPDRPRPRGDNGTIRVDPRDFGL